MSMFSSYEEGEASDFCPRKLDAGFVMDDDCTIVN